MTGAGCFPPDSLDAAAGIAGLGAGGREWLWETEVRAGAWEEIGQRQRWQKVGVWSYLRQPHHPITGKRQLVSLLGSITNYG